MQRWHHCHSFIESNITVIKYQRLMKREQFLLSHHYPCWLVNKFTLYIFTLVVTPGHRAPAVVRTQAGARGSPDMQLGRYSDLLFWSEFPHSLSGLPCPPLSSLVPGAGGWGPAAIRRQLTQSCWHANTGAGSYASLRKWLLICGWGKLVLGLWQTCVRAINRWIFINRWHLDKHNLNEMLILDFCLAPGKDSNGCHSRSSITSAE